jgi:hypothetical protein
MEFSAAAVDVGFGETKWAVRLEDEIITGSFLLSLRLPRK